MNQQPQIRPTAAAFLLPSAEISARIDSIWGDSAARIEFHRFKPVEPKRLELPDLSARARSALTLGKDINFASFSAEDKRKLARIKRFALLSVARSLLKPHAVGACMRVPIGRPEIVSKLHVDGDHEERRAHLRNIVTCGNVWVCPVCAHKISGRKQQELAQGIRSHDGTVVLSTFTLQHSLSDGLKPLLTDLNAGMQDLTSGSWYIDFRNRWGIIGSVKSLEFTVSSKSGWHPHKHLLFFSIKPVEDLDQAEMQHELSSKFVKIMQKYSRYVSPLHGVRVEKGLGAQTDGDEALKRYVGKWGISKEMTLGASKTGRFADDGEHYTPWELLELAGQGDRQAAAWWIEYVQASKGCSQLRWSPSLRGKLGLSKTEKSDQELAKEETSPDDFLLAQLNLLDWAVVTGNDAIAELLNIADRGDAAGIHAFIFDLRHGRSGTLAKQLVPI